MRRWALVVLFTWCGANLPVLWAQTTVAFEVASVKVNKNGNGVIGGCHGVDSKYSAAQLASAPPLGRCVVIAGRLSHMIGIAWELPMSVIRGGPDWLMRGFDRFDVQAEAEDPTKTNETQLRAMLQALLIERFQLKFHRETVERPGFALVVGEKGARMKLATGTEMSINFGDQVKPSPLEPVTLTARKYTMARLASILAFAAQQPVVDRTGLSGEYDFTLHWDQDQGPTLETAVREQLGLKLAPQKVPVELFVVDSAQKPSAN
jgi:uncharacterized protein (TIGR03435 family)